MTAPHERTDPRLVIIPSSDSAFGAHVTRIHRRGMASAAALEARLRRMFPRVAVRERSLSGEAPTWYVYRDGRWRAPEQAAWWTADGLPRVDLAADGWLAGATPTAAGLLGIDPADATSHHFTDFVVPGTLEDSLSLFRLLEEGAELDATTLLRPLSGDVIAVDLHARRAGDRIEAVYRLASDLDLDLDPESLAPAPHPAVDWLPPTDVAFRGYGLRALARMPEPTADGLALRLRRLYPHAGVADEGDRWVARRDPAASAGTDAGGWWDDPALPSVRYDAQALIVGANDAATRFFGRELVGHHWQEFVTPGSTEQVSVMLEILAEAGAAESRFRMPRPDGSLMEFDSYTSVDGSEFVTVFRAAAGNT